MRILITQPIFAPDKKRLERNLESITSIRNFKTIDCELYFGGYAANDDYKKQITDTIKFLPFWSHNPSGEVKLIQFHDKNYGKAFVVNHLVCAALKDKPYDYMFTMDSDMKIPEGSSVILKRLLECVQQMESHKHKPCGVVAPNMTGYNCHVIENCKNSFEYTNSFNMKERVIWPTPAAHIAGGCFFLNLKAWKEIGGYKVMGVYAGDEAYYLQDLNKHGYTWQILETAYIEHPHENDLEYALWKNKVCARDSDGKTKSDISKQIQETEEFWRNRCQ
jgi:hypothetical protein